MGATLLKVHGIIKVSGMWVEVKSKYDLELRKMGKHTIRGKDKVLLIQVFPGNVWNKFRT